MPAVNEVFRPESPEFKITFGESLKEPEQALVPIKTAKKIKIR